MPVFAASLAFTVLFVLQIDASTVPTATAAPCVITVPQQLLLSPQSWAPHPLVHILVAADDGATTALVATESVDGIPIGCAPKSRCRRRRRRANALWLSPRTLGATSLGSHPRHRRRSNKCLRPSPPHHLMVFRSAAQQIAAAAAAVAVQAPLAVSRTLSK